MKMKSLSRSRALPVAIAGLLLVLLLVLAHLQWRWIGEVSRLERHRRETTIMMTGARLAEDLDGVVMRIFAALHPDFAAPAGERLQAMVAQLDRSRADPEVPGLIGAVYLIRADGRAPLLERLEPDQGRFVPRPWPSELAGLRDELGNRPARPGQPAGGDQPEPFVARRLFASGVPALLIPLALPRPPGIGATDPLASAALLVLLDERTLSAEVLPELARKALAWRAGEDVMLAVVDPARPGHVVYRSDPAAPAELRGADLRLPLLGPRPLVGMRPFLGDRPARHLHLHAAAIRPHADHMPAAERPAGQDGPSDGWWLLVRRRGRSVEEAVAALRWRNLAVSLGILGFLAAAAVVLVATTQRAQRLARQQIEFVAGVTHELHTPLAAIRAAGENLADGVVADAAQVRRYGLLVEREGRRLSTLVAELLELAGIQSGRRVYRFEPVEVGEVVESALRESRWLLEEADVIVERDLPDGLPHVLADPGALRRGLQNLVENAVKYGGQARWLGVRARAAADEVDIEIADRGPGIRRDELPHLFEPFFRGRDAAARGVPGVGLGLALVRQIAQAHGGRVTVASEPDGPGQGTCFTLHLPAAPAPDPEVA